MLVLLDNLLLYELICLRQVCKNVIVMGENSRIYPVTNAPTYIKVLCIHVRWRFSQIRTQLNVFVKRRERVTILLRLYSVVLSNKSARGSSWLNFAGLRRLLDPSNLSHAIYVQTLS